VRYYIRLRFVFFNFIYLPRLSCKYIFLRRGIGGFILLEFTITWNWARQLENSIRWT